MEYIHLNYIPENVENVVVVYCSILLHVTYSRSLLVQPSYIQMAGKVIEPVTFPIIYREYEHFSVFLMLNLQIVQKSY
jgi:hypothetical protein